MPSQYLGKAGSLQGILLEETVDMVTVSDGIGDGISAMASYLGQIQVTAVTPFFGTYRKG